MAQTINLLLVEDSAADARLTREMLKGSDEATFRLQQAACLADARRLLAAGRFDAVLLDLGLPDSHGLDTFLQVQERVPETAVVVYSTMDDRDMAIAAVKRGAQDSLVKGSTSGDLLARSLRYSIERKRAEAALVASERNFRSSMDSSPLGIRIVRFHDDGTLYANRAFLDIFGYRTIEEFAAVPPSRRYTPESYAAYVARRERRQKGRAIEFSYEMEIVRPDGQVRRAEVFLRPTRWDGQPQHQLIYRDITEHRRLLGMLQAQKELTDRVLASTPNGVLVLDRDRRAVLANRAFREDFQEGRGEAGGRLLDEVLYFAGLAEHVTAVFETGEPRRDLELRHRTGDTERTVMAQIVPLAASRDEVLLLLQDVTSERALQQQLLHAGRLKSLGEMAAGAAHELNNPLTCVVLCSELLQRSELPEQAMADVTAIHESAMRMERIVGQMLSFAGKGKTEKRPVDINEVVSRALEMGAYHFKTGDIRLDIDLASGLPRVTADLQQMQQVFLNIIQNAGQAMLGAHGRGNLSARTRREGSWVTVSFADDGPGMPAHIRQRVFDPFFTTKEPGRGTGLGLSICLGIVTEHGGQIGVRSEEGKGATFEVRLPAAVSNALSSPGPGRSPARKGPRRV